MAEPTTDFVEDEGAEGEAVWIADVQRRDHEMDRPYLLVYFHAGDDADEALRIARLLTLADDEYVRSAKPLQPILDEVLARPADFGISWKSEGSHGPVHLTDRTKLPEERGARVVPFGSQSEWDIPLPWSTRAEARRLAKYLGLTLEEW